MLNTPSSYRGMVTTPHHLASQAGLDILKAGGSAMEAAVAVAATLAVVYPHMNSIGGDSFWLIREGERVRAIHGVGGAAETADLDLYRGYDAVPWRGPLAANTVAGTISAWQAVLEGGELPLDQLLESAVYYAEHGVAVTAGGAEIAAAKDDLRHQFGYSEVFRPGGRPLEVGDRLKQPALGRTLRRLAAEGLNGFYDGGLAREIAADLAAAGSPVSAIDLLEHRVIRATPLTARLGDVRLYNTAPPTQGLASLLILALFERLGLGDPDSVGFVHGLVEATKQAFILRDRHIGNPDFLSVEAQELLDDGDLLDRLAARIGEDALPWPHVASHGDTVWFGVIDGEGRAVSAIQSTYFEFGSGLVLPQTGIVWQNRGASFTLTEEGPRALKPGRKPFHTLNPAMALFDDGRVMAYGTMGGEGQPQTQAALFSRYRMGMPLQQAITAPRWLLGKTWGEASVNLKLESRFDPGLITALHLAGHDVERVAPFTSMMGHAGALVRHPDGRLEGATDPRSDGSVAAW